MNKFLAYIKLTRPANIITSLADILAGFAASGAASHILSKVHWNFGMQEMYQLYTLLLSSACLYGGGVVLNDVFDYEIDQTERPERPLPSGKASVLGATILGIFLSFAGIGIAFLSSTLSCVIAMAIVCLSLLYNKYLKDHFILGPLNMAACRISNLLLGMSVVNEIPLQAFLLLIIPLLYILSISILSRGEVFGGEKKSIETSILLYILVLIVILNLTFLDKFSFLSSFPFLALFTLFSFPGFLKALKNSDQPLMIRKAVKNAILSLIILNASIVAGFAGLSFGFLVLLLLPLSIWLAKTFAVS